MSLPFKNNHPALKKGGIIGLGLIGLLGVAASVVPASGAWFSDSKQTDVTVTTGAVSLDLRSDSAVNDDGRLELRFDNIKPSESVRTFFTAHNAGTSAAELTVFSDGLAAGGPDPSKLHFTVDGYGPDIPVQGQGAPLDLGRLDPGDTQAFWLTMSLDSTAGNEWQNVSVTDPIHVTLTQPHP